MNKSKLSKETLERFSISFNKAKELKITDEDLKYISEIGPDKFRISIRKPGSKERYTEVVYGLLNAINRKWEILDSIRKQCVRTQREGINAYIDFTVKDGFENFLEYRKELVNKKGPSGKPELRRSTYEKNLITYKDRLISESDLLNMKIVDVSTEIAQAFVDKLLSTRRLDSDELLSENTTNRHYAFVHMAFEYFKNTLKVISSNPFDATKGKPKYRPKNRDYLATIDMHFVLDEISKKNIRFKTLINLVLETGMRIEEAVAIKFSDINRYRSTINIMRSVTKSRLTGELIVEDLLKTDASIREITISDCVLSLIDHYRSFREELGMKVSNDDFIFTSWDDNELISPDRYTEEWNKFLDQLGYNSQDLPLRIVRHSSASFMLQGETNFKAVKKRFGWSKDSTMMAVYEQSNLDDDRRLLEKFDEEFRNALGVSYAELYSICMGRLNNKRKINNVLQKILNKSVDEIDYDTDLQLCKNYLFDLFPIFNKIAKIDDELDDEDIEALLIGFKPIYKKIKIEPLKEQITQR